MPTATGRQAATGGVSLWRSRALPALAKSSLTVSLIGLALVQTYGSAQAEFPTAELRDVALLGAAVNIPLLVAALTLLRPRAANAVLALITVISMASVNLIHTDLYLTGSRALLVPVTLVVGAGVFAALEFMDSNRWMRGGVPAAALVALALMIVSHLPSPAVERHYASQVRPVDFESTPNLYFVSLDGLAPQALQQEYLDIATTDLMDLLNAEFRRLPNMFSDSPWSRISLSILLSVSPEIYWETHVTGEDPGYLAGRSPRPLFDILRDNGYETTFVYANGNLGVAKGPHLDNLRIARPRAVCELLDQSIVGLAFWGYCHLPMSEGGELSGTPAEWTAAQVERIIRAADQRDPQFVLAYFKYPGHVDRSFDYYDLGLREAYRQRWVSRSDHSASLLADLIAALEEHDPTAILFVFGDHGIRLSVNVDFADDPEFVIKDSYAIYGGIYPRGACAAWFDQALSLDHLTLSDAVDAVLRCLSGGREALVEPRERLIRNGRGRIPRDGVERSFSDFLYE